MASSACNDVMSEKGYDDTVTLAEFDARTRHAGHCGPM